MQSRRGETRTPDVACCSTRDTSVSEDGEGGNGMADKFEDTVMDSRPKPQPSATATALLCTTHSHRACRMMTDADDEGYVVWIKQVQPISFFSEKMLIIYYLIGINLFSIILFSRSWLLWQTSSHVP